MLCRYLCWINLFNAWMHRRWLTKNVLHGCFARAGCEDYWTTRDREINDKNRDREINDKNRDRGINDKNRDRGISDKNKKPWFQTQLKTAYSHVGPDEFLYLTRLFLRHGQWNADRVSMTVLEAALSNRSINVPTDEFLCLRTLLNLDMKKIFAISKIRKWCRYEHFFMKLKVWQMTRFLQWDQNSNRMNTIELQRRFFIRQTIRLNHIQFNPKQRWSLMNCYSKVLIFL